MNKIDAKMTGNSQQDSIQRSLEHPDAFKKAINLETLVQKTLIESESAALRTKELKK